MGEIQATFLITTPMFLAGADVKEPAELRAASVKGVLRFWFRAISYGRFENVARVREEEGRIFGSTTAQSNVFLRLKSNAQVITKQSEIRKVFRYGIAYLGYGLDYDNGDSKKSYRSFLDPKGTFSVDLLIKPAKRAFVDQNALIRSFEALGLFGGLGSRSRRGFGSLTLTSLQANGEENWNPPHSREELRERFRDFFRSLQLGQAVPEYTAFNQATRTVILQEHTDYLTALQEVGEAMMEFRRGYKADGELVERFIREGKVEKHPQRVAFGLPHNYFFPNLGEAEIAPLIDVDLARRASPLFIKIISLETNNGLRYVPVLTIFPATFLPSASSISMKTKRTGRSWGKPRKVRPEVSFALIDEFMDGFPKRLEVKPFD